MSNPTVSEYVKSEQFAKKISNDIVEVLKFYQEATNGVLKISNREGKAYINKPALEHEIGLQIKTFDDLQTLLNYSMLEIGAKSERPVPLDDNITDKIKLSNQLATAPRKGLLFLYSMIREMVKVEVNQKKS